MATSDSVERDFQEKQRGQLLPQLGSFKGWQWTDAATISQRIKR